MRLKTGCSRMSRRLFQRSSIWRGFVFTATRRTSSSGVQEPSCAALYLRSASVLWYNLSFGQFHTCRPIGTLPRILIKIAACLTYKHTWQYRHSWPIGHDDSTHITQSLKIRKLVTSSCPALFKGDVPRSPSPLRFSHKIVTLLCCFLSLL